MTAFVPGIDLSRSFFLEVVRDGLAFTRFETRQTEALLSYLAYYTKRAHAREELP